jgi:GNAT superfamily N-acetyltransferase
MRFREAARADAIGIAKLHAASWRANYRGAYSDEYLDGNVVEERLRVWEERMSTPAPNQFVVLAEEDDDLIGFACAYGGHDETWGSLLDNIHVRPGHQSHGVGARLVAEVAAWCRANYSNCGLYLWVLEQNVRAQRFYKRLGAIDQGGRFSEPPGGGQIHATHGRQSPTFRGRDRVALVAQAQARQHLVPAQVHFAPPPLAIVPHMRRVTG